MRRRRKKTESESSPKNPTKTIRNCPEGQEFVFVTPEGREVGRARNIIEFIRLVKTVPLESVLYHTNGRHFGPWLNAIGEKKVAKRVNEVKGQGEGVRLQIIRCI